MVTKDNLPSFCGYYESPIGLIEIGGTTTAVTQLNFVEQQRLGLEENEVIQETITQLDAYFKGQRQQFDIPLDLTGTHFQQTVWQQLLHVPYGQVASYQDIAHAINKPRAMRAVGAANGQNPVSIVVPCHRIIGSNGRLTGYGGGLWRKEWLLKHEGYLLL